MPTMTRHRLVRLAALASGVVFALVVGSLVLGTCVIKAKASGYIYSEVAQVPKHRWAIVPGAAVQRDGNPSLALLDRIDAARALFAAGLVDTIFVSGDARSRDEDGVMARWLVAHGVPADRIVRDGMGYRTRDTMEDAVRLGITDAVICTQAFHVPRSVAWARHLGMTRPGSRPICGGAIASRTNGSARRSRGRSRCSRSGWTEWLRASSTTAMASRSWRRRCPPITRS
jgi:vancomycin permeability regulator SanA